MPSRNRDAFHRVKMEGALLRLQGRSNPSRELAELARVQVPGLDDAPAGSETGLPCSVPYDAGRSRSCCVARPES